MAVQKFYVVSVKEKILAVLFSFEDAKDHVKRCTDQGWQNDYHYHYAVDPTVKRWQYSDLTDYRITEVENETMMDPLWEKTHVVCTVRET